MRKSESNLLAVTFVFELILKTLDLLKESNKLVLNLLEYFFMPNKCFFLQRKLQTYSKKGREKVDGKHIDKTKRRQAETFFFWQRPSRLYINILLITTS